MSANKNHITQYMPLKYVYTHKIKSIKIYQNRKRLFSISKAFKIYLQIRVILYILF